MTTWTDEMKESVSKQWLNPFIVLDCKNEIVGVYRKSKHCERESEFGFSSMGIKKLEHTKDSDLRKFQFKSILSISVRNNK